MTVARRRLKTCIGAAVSANPWITGVASDSRALRRGELFVAIRGASHDGHDFVDEAIAAGARAIVVERVDRDVGAKPVPVVRVADTRLEAGRIASRFYGNPSRKIGCIGVTGTNGKTSVAHFCAELLSRCGMPAGYAGTLGWTFGGRRCRGGLTTEDAITVQKRLDALVGYGAKWVAMEASSHALDQHRVDAVEFRIAVFTNLTRDHLDYHGSMARYGAAKARLFAWPSLEAAIVNVDDAFGRAMLASLPSTVRAVRVGRAPDADIAFRDAVFHDAGVTATLVTPFGEARLELALMGDFMLDNVAAAFGAAHAAGAPFDALLRALPALESPPGRMQFLRAPQRAPVVVDYAHTPDALEKLLAAARRHCRGRIVCVFGCGGDRDTGKRALMAAAVEAGADRAIVTNDNPRSEDPAAIADAIERGFTGKIEHVRELDRARAIAIAIEGAEPSDLIVVAGKGHEDYQEIHGARVHFSDVEAVEAAWHGARSESERDPA